MNIEPLKTFLSEEIPPVELARLLDEFIFDYIDRLIRLHQHDDKISLHIDTSHFIYFIKKMRDILLDC